jgi:hypothetical protein
MGFVGERIGQSVRSRPAANDGLYHPRAATYHVFLAFVSIIAVSAGYLLYTCVECMLPYSVAIPVIHAKTLSCHPSRLE